MHSTARRRRIRAIVPTLVLTVVSVLAAAPQATAASAGPAIAQSPLPPLGIRLVDAMSVPSGTKPPVIGDRRVIKNRGSGRCLGISLGLAGIWTCTGQGGDQTWRFDPDNYAVDPSGNKWYRLVNDAGQCLAVNGGSTSHGARILGYQCNFGDDQYWSPAMNLDANGDYLLGNMKGYLTPNSTSGAAWIVGVDGGQTSNGAAAILWSVDGQAGSPNQRWLLPPSNQPSP